MAACPNCKATLGVKRLKCPECGHEREPEPQPEAEPDGEPKGWAAAYAPRQPANNMDRVAAVLRQYADGNFSGAGPGSTPGLSQIWKKGGSDLVVSGPAVPPVRGDCRRHDPAIAVRARRLAGAVRGAAQGAPRARQARGAGHGHRFPSGAVLRMHASPGGPRDGHQGQTLPVAASRRGPAVAGGAGAENRSDRSRPRAREAVLHAAR
jgi:hypothetical protein